MNKRRKESHRAEQQGRKASQHCVTFPSFAVPTFSPFSTAMARSPSRRSPRPAAPGLPQAVALTVHASPAGQGKIGPAGGKSVGLVLWGFASRCLPRGDLEIGPCHARASGVLRGNEGIDNDHGKSREEGTNLKPHREMIGGRIGKDFLHANLPIYLPLIALRLCP